MLCASSFLPEVLASALLRFQENVLTLLSVIPGDFTSKAEFSKI